MNIQNRIEQAAACKFIDLTESEKDIYCGCGWKLARFVNSTLVELFELADVESRDDQQSEVSDSLTRAIEWLGRVEGEVLLVMCSCYQLCDPCPISFKDASSMAKLARSINEEIGSIY